MFDENSEATNIEREYYRRGVVEGMTRYAWWKDGVQYVGDGHHTLRQAIERFNLEWRGEVA